MRLWYAPGLSDKVARMFAFLVWMEMAAKSDTSEAWDNWDDLESWDVSSGLQQLAACEIGIRGGILSLSVEQQPGLMFSVVVKFPRRGSKVEAPAQKMALVPEATFLRFSTGAWRASTFLFCSYLLFAPGAHVSVACCPPTSSTPLPLLHPPALPLSARSAARSASKCPVQNV